MFEPLSRGIPQYWTGDWVRVWEGDYARRHFDVPDQDPRSRSKFFRCSSQPLLFSAAILVRAGSNCLLEAAQSFWQGLSPSLYPCKTKGLTSRCRVILFSAQQFILTDGTAHWPVIPLCLPTARHCHEVYDGAGRHACGCSKRLFLGQHL